MKKRISTFFIFAVTPFLVTPQVLAAKYGCESQEKLGSGQSVAALYQIETTQKNGKKEKKSLLFARQRNQIIYTQNYISEIWELTKNGKMKLFKYFDQFEKGIEYQPNEILAGASDSWGDKKGLITQSMFGTMDVTETTQNDCKVLTSFQRVNAKANVTETAKVLKLTKYNLPEKFKLNTYVREVTWKLMSLETEPTAVNAYFKKYDNFDLVDYADVGDNESDPFLQKMINLGFIAHSETSYYSSEKGVYPVSGDAHEHGHSH